MLSTFMHWLHLLGVVFWIGGVGYILLVLMPAMSTVALRDRARMVSILLRKFLTVVWVSIGLIVVSGLFCVFFILQITSFKPLILSSYGNLLLVKMLLVVGLIGAASAVTFRQYSRTLKHVTTHLNDPPNVYSCQLCGSVMGSMRDYLVTGLAPALVIIFIAALLRGA